MTDDILGSFVADSVRCNSMVKTWTAQCTQGNCATEGNSGNCQSGNCHSGGEVDEEAFRTRWQMKIKWRHRQHCEWSRQQHVLLYVIKWQMIRFQALWKTKSFVKVCLKFKLPLWTNGLLIHLSPLWQLPLWHFPRSHNFPVYIIPAPPLSTMADASMASSGTCHCYPEWHNFPV